MNKVVLLGRMAKDPDLTFAAGSGTAVCKFNLAVKRPFKKDETDFINCIAFGKTGENIAQYFAKGSQICLAGSIRTGSYDAKDGTKRYTTDVIIDTFDFVDSKGSSGNAANNSFAGNVDTGVNGFDDMTPIDDGDIPF